MPIHFHPLSYRKFLKHSPFINWPLFESLKGLWGLRWNGGDGGGWKEAGRPTDAHHLRKGER